MAVIPQGIVLLRLFGRVESARLRALPPPVETEVSPGGDALPWEGAGPAGPTPLPVAFDFGSGSAGISRGVPSPSTFLRGADGIVNLSLLLEALLAISHKAKSLL